MLPKDDLKEFNTASSIEIFKQHGIQAKASHFKTYVFPNSFEFAKTERAKCLGRNDPKVVAFEFHGFADKVYAIDKKK